VRAKLNSIIDPFLKLLCSTELSVEVPVQKPFKGELLMNGRT